MKQRMGALLLLLFLLTPVLSHAQSAKQEDWRAVLKRELPVMGHRNWIVVADSAYPAQTSAGVVTIYTGASQIETVQEVLKIMSTAKHVVPILYTDAELKSIPESLAPGIEKYRADLKKTLGKRPVKEVLHEELIGKLDEAGKTFKVIILKTNLTLPYTSVFFQLDCGYWGPEKERRLREAMGTP